MFMMVLMLVVVIMVMLVIVVMVVMVLVVMVVMVIVVMVVVTLFAMLMMMSAFRTNVLFFKQFFHKIVFLFHRIQNLFSVDLIPWSRNN